MNLIHNNTTTYPGTSFFARREISESWNSWPTKEKKKEAPLFVTLKSVTFSFFFQVETNLNQKNCKRGKQK